MEIFVVRARSCEAEERIKKRMEGVLGRQVEHSSFFQERFASVFKLTGSSVESVLHYVRVSFGFLLQLSDYELFLEVNVETNLILAS